ncbi:MAG: hypothetical protein ACR2PS_17875 [Pseudomonadales bacterium]
MTELNDYSGTFKPELRFDNFSRELLLKLVKNWQWAWMHLDHAFFEQFIMRNQLGKAFEMDMAMWLRVATRVNPVFAQVAGIPINNVVDCHKAYQLPLDNTMGELWSTSIQFVDEYESVHEVNQCPALDWIEDNAPERITGLCQLDRKVIERYKINMDVELTPVRLPPRASKDEKPCAWRLKMDMPEDAPRTPLEKLVDWTESPPEVDDLTGPLYPHLTHENFSKSFLLRMMEAWQYAWITLAESHFLTARKEHGHDAAMEICDAAWAKAIPGIQGRYAATAGITANSVVDSLKLMQLAMDTPIGPLFQASYDIKNDNHVIMAIAQRDQVPHPDWPAPELDIALAQGDWAQRISLSLYNPEIALRALDTIPQPGNGNIACRWELRL